MPKINVKSVLEKIRAGSYTPEEETIAKYWLHQLHQKDESDYTENDLNRIGDEIYNAVMQENTSPRTKVRLWPRIGLAAAIATIIVSVGIWFFKSPSKEVQEQQQAYHNNITPGKQGATLTLGNGKKISLSDAVNGELAKEAGVIISKTADGQIVYEIQESNAASAYINTLSTSRGETFQVRLPDGSAVWLNSASTLKYPASFAKLASRRVELEGEGYFEIAKDKAHPFIVKTAKQEVEVLGTHFNISSYTNEEVIKTTLLEGSVRIHIRAGALKSTILKPGQEAALLGNKLNISEVEPEDAVAWKNGYFSFNSENLESLMNKIARWYDVEVVFKDPSLKEETFLGTISRFEKISKVLNMLERTDVATFKIEGKTINISKKR